MKLYILHGYRISKFLLDSLQENARSWTKLPYFKLDTLSDWIKDRVMVVASFVKTVIVTLKGSMKTKLS